MKICVIGNSHCSALVTAWKEMQATSDYSLTFFAAPGARPKGLEVSDGTLVPTNPKTASMMEYTSKGRKKIDPSDYDRFLIYGLIPQPSATSDDFGHSQALRKAIVESRFTESPARDLVFKIKEISPKPVDVAPAPFEFLETGLRAGSWKFDCDSEAILFRRHCNEIGANFIEQPFETVFCKSTRRTRDQFSEGSQKLAIDDNTSGTLHPKSDIKHANGKFGILWLNNYFERISS